MRITKRKTFFLILIVIFFKLITYKEMSYVEDFNKYFSLRRNSKELSEVTYRYFYRASANIEEVRDLEIIKTNILNKSTVIHKREKNMTPTETEYFKTRLIPFWDDEIRVHSTLIVNGEAKEIELTYKFYFEFGMHRFWLYPAYIITQQSSDPPPIVFIKYGGTNKED